MGYLKQSLGYALRRAQLTAFHEIYRSFGDRSLTLVQFSTLAIVEDNPGVSQAVLAEALAVERPRIVPILNDLIDRGLVSRRVNPADRRARMIEITREGSAVLERHKNALEIAERNLVHRLPVGAQKQLTDVLWTIANFDSEERTTNND